MSSADDGVEPLKIDAAHYEMQGPVRPTMEDESVMAERVVLAAADDAAATANITSPVSVYAVYDGHGGRACARYVAKHLHANVLTALAASTAKTTRGSGNAVVAVDAVLKQAFTDTDDACCAWLRARTGDENDVDDDDDGAAAAAAAAGDDGGNGSGDGNDGDSGISSSNTGGGGDDNDGAGNDDKDNNSNSNNNSSSSNNSHSDSSQSSHDRSGSTAVFAVLEHNTGQLWVAHCGDSRAILCRDGTALALTDDHKASREDEHARIRAAGGFVIMRRVMGELAVSRAFGDVDFKEERCCLVTALPEVREIALSSARDTFIVLACDGLYDVLTSDEVCAFVTDAFARGLDAQACVHALVTHAVEERRSRDNVSAIVIRITPASC